MSAGTPLSWIQAAADNELRIIEDDGNFAVRYRVHKVDAKGDTVRDTIEGRDGAVARLVQRNGRPLTPEEDAAERLRLQDMLGSPADFAKRHKRNSSARGYASDLVRLMPRAMIYTYAPGQPQLPGAAWPQVVIDFRPDPKFQPPSMMANLLTGLEGRLWIDAHTRTLLRGEARVSRPVNFGWGVIARIYPGGTVVFEQAPLPGGHWIYSHVDTHLSVREVLVKTNSMNSAMTASDFQMLPAQMSWQQAIHTLLDMPLPAK